MVPFSELEKDKKLMAIAMTWAKAQHNDENLQFLTSKDSDPKKLWPIFFSDTGKYQVNLPGNIINPMKELAERKNDKGKLDPDWKHKDWKDLIAKAKKNIEALWQVNSKDFVITDLYKDYKFPERQNTLKLIPGLEKAIDEGLKFYKTATANVEKKGLPSDKVEVKRMFESGRMRHDKVHESFTDRLKVDKYFVRDNFKAFFAEKDKLTKAWGEYRKLITA